MPKENAIPIPGTAAKKPLMLLLVKRTCIFLLIMSLLTAFMYAVGNAQDFLPSTQLSLLSLSSGLGTLTGVDALYGVALSVIAAVSRKRRSGTEESLPTRRLRPVAAALSYLLLAAYGFVLAGGSSVILIAAAGNA